MGREGALCSPEVGRRAPRSLCAAVSDQGFEIGPPHCDLKVPGAEPLDQEPPGSPALGKPKPQPEEMRMGGRKGRQAWHQCAVPSGVRQKPTLLGAMKAQLSHHPKAPQVGFEAGRRAVGDSCLPQRKLNWPAREKERRHAPRSRLRVSERQPGHLDAEA